MSAAPDAAPERADTSVVALLPLALLESVRRHDRPREVLEDENLADSLPRRLGLTHVVESQIHRYEKAGRRGSRVPADEVRSLLQLVLRRPDAETILHEAGRHIAQRRLGDGSAVRAAARRMLPERAAFVAARRAARRLLRRLVANGSVEATARPFTVRVRGGLTTGLDQDDAAVCSLYTGVLSEVLGIYRLDRDALGHPTCIARGDGACEWNVDTGA